MDWSAGLRPASRPERAAKPHTANPRGWPSLICRQRPSFRCRLTHERRSPTGIAAREGRETTHRQPARVAQSYLSPGGPVSDVASHGLERRSPTGIAAREGRETTHRQPARVAQSYLSPDTAGAPVSDRHRPAQRGEPRTATPRKTREPPGNADLRPVSRWGPAPHPAGVRTTYSHPRKSGTFSKPRSGTFSKPIDSTAPHRGANHVQPPPRQSPDTGAPVSDRHRGPRGPRNHTPPTRVSMGFENVPLFRGDWVPAEGWVDGIWRAPGREVPPEFGVLPFRPPAAGGRDNPNQRAQPAGWRTAARSAAKPPAATHPHGGLRPTSPWSREITSRRPRQCRKPHGT